MSEGRHVYEAICEVTATMAREGIGKTRENKQQGYRFRSVDDVYAAIGGLLAANKICMLPRVTERTMVERPTKNGGMSTYATLTVEFDIVSAVDGSKHTICTMGEAMDTADKSTNKAMSAAFKYACFLAFQIPVDGVDNDSDYHHHEKAPEPARQPEKSDAEKLIGNMFAVAKTTQEIAEAEAAALRAINAKKVVNGGRERLLKLRSEAIARVGGQ